MMRPEPITTDPLEFLAIVKGGQLVADGSFKSYKNCSCRENRTITTGARKTSVQMNGKFTAPVAIKVRNLKAGQKKPYK